MSDDVWLFDGAGDRLEIFSTIVGLHAGALQELLPPERDDAFEQLMAELDHQPDRSDMTDVGRRLFPEASSDPEVADEFARNAMTQQARVRLDSARCVLADLALADDDGVVPVTRERAEHWIRTLAALRVDMTVRITEDASRFASPSRQDVSDDPFMAMLIDWLGYELEELLEWLA